MLLCPSNLIVGHVTTRQTHIGDTSIATQLFLDHIARKREKRCSERARLYHDQKKKSNEVSV
jgi:hypothetical protein